MAEQQENHRKQPRARREFTKEFKHDAVELVNARLRMERDLLKRTVAFWVKETSTP